MTNRPCFCMMYIRVSPSGPASAPVWRCASLARCSASLTRDGGHPHSPGGGCAPCTPAYLDDGPRCAIEADSPRAIRARENECAGGTRRDAQRPDWRSASSAAPPCTPLPLRDERAGDDFQFEGGLHALKDWQHLRIDDVAADAILFGVAPAAVQQLRFLGDLDGDVRREELRHRGAKGRAGAGRRRARDVVGELSRGGDARRHLPDLVPRELVLADRPAELDALRDVGARLLERGLRDAKRPAARLQAADGEAPERQVEAAALALLFADEVLRGHEKILEVEHEGVHAAVSRRRDGLAR